MKPISDRKAQVLGLVIVLTLGFALAFPLIYLVKLFGPRLPFPAALFVTTLAAGLALEDAANRILIRRWGQPPIEAEPIEESPPEPPPAMSATSVAMMKLLGRRIVVDGIPYLLPPEANVATLAFKNAVFEMRVIAPPESPACLGQEKIYSVAVDEDFELYLTRNPE